MTALVLVHILSAIIGVGPVFFYPVLFRKNQTAAELKHSLAAAFKLEFFPKIGGTIAVLSGITLAIIGNYGSFFQLWLAGSLVLYILIQIIVIGMVAPKMKKLSEWFNNDNDRSAELPDHMKALHLKILNHFTIACILGLVLFIFMILKP